MNKSSIKVSNCNVKTMLLIVFMGIMLSLLFPSNIVYAKAKKPSAPKSLKVKVVETTTTDNTIKISWKKVKGATRYKVIVTKNGELVYQTKTKKCNHTVMIAVGGTLKVSVQAMKPNKKKYLYSKKATKTIELSFKETTTIPGGEFAQYVYEEGGRVCFRYTGTGKSVIVVPEGVQKITGFSDDIFKFNDEITTVYLPSTLLSIRNMNMYNQEQYGWENVLYVCLYQCRNLKTVYSSCPYYQVDSKGVWRPLADGSKLYVWSPTTKIPYDKSKYYETNSIVNP